MNKSIKINYLLLLIAITGLLYSCENPIEVVNSISENKKLPTLSGENYEIIFSDSGIVQVKVVTPELNRYPLSDKPYYEFPKGMNVYFYNKYGLVTSQISSEYAIYFEKDRLWEARTNVVAINDKGEKLNTEQLFWDEKKGIIYSKKFSRVTSKDQVFYGKEGFEANQNFTKWKLIGTKGTVNIKDE